MKLFIPPIKEDLNRPYDVTLTEGQIATILYVMEGYIQGNDEYENRFKEDVDNIFEVLESAVDNYYSKVEAAQKKQPIPEWDDTVEDAQVNDVSYSPLNENTEYGKDVRTADDVAKCIVDSDGEYADCVDQLVDSMNPRFHMDRAFAKLRDSEDI